MKLIRKIVCVALALSTVMCLFGCGKSSGSYPVTVGNLTFDESPEKVTVLSSNIADIMTMLGYQDKINLVSDAVITKGLKNKKSCGDSIDPDTSLIIDSGAEVVFADDNVSDGVTKTLRDNDINVVQFHYGNDDEEISTTYGSVASIIEGVKGKEKGKEVYSELTDKLSMYEKAVSDKYSKEKLMYLSGTAPFVTTAKKTWYSKVLGYAGVVDCSKKSDSVVVDLIEIEEENPDYLVYDTETLKALKDKSSLKDCTFLKDKHSIRIDKECLKLQGVTALENVKKIIGMIDSEASKKFEEQENITVKGTTAQKTSVVVTETKGTQGTTGGTTSSESDTETSSEVKSKYELASKYNVTFDKQSIATMKKDKENKYIKAMQTRLSELGYLDEFYITGYLGDLTINAIQKFETANNLDADGEVTEKLLEKLFSSSAKSFS